MLEVKTNKEIRNIKSEIFFGLGIREIIIFGITTVIVAYLFLVLKLNEILVSIIASPILALATMLAVARPCGVAPEQFLIAMLKSMFINNRKLIPDDEGMKEVERRVTTTHRKKGLH